MGYFIFGPAFLALLIFWGAGLAWWLVPKRWEKVWPLWIPVAGWVLMGLVVWLGTWLGLNGVSTFVWPAQLLPLVLLLGAVQRRGSAAFGRDLWKWKGVGAAVFGAAALLWWPLAWHSNELTTVALTSCDAADYAAGARALLEFGRYGEGGFIHLAEVVRVGTVENFTDYWLRLNHFLTAAVPALYAGTFDLPVQAVITLTTTVMLATILPGAYFFCRVGVRLRREASMALSLVATLSPVTLYAVTQVAIAQVMMASAIAYLTGVGLLLWRRPAREGWVWFGALVVAYAQLWGAYSFIMGVAWMPALTALVVRRGFRLPDRAWVESAAAFLLPALVAGLLFFDRVLGVVERVQLLRDFDFGWKIALVTPEGWLGLVSDAQLTPWSGPLRWVTLALLLLLWVAGWRRLRGQQRGELLALLAAPLFGYTYLQIRGAWLGTHASYDAYKVLAVFFPLVLAGLWPLWGWASGQRFRGLPWVALGVFLWVGFAPVYAVLRRPPLVVTPDLAALQQVETLPGVSSVNLRVDDFWSRLWANAFLLRLPHYFPSHTYEGRLPTALRGTHDLQDAPVAGASSSGWVSPQGRFLLSPAGHLLVRWAEGWHAEEHDARGRQRWRWSPRAGSFVVESSAAGTAEVALQYRVLQATEVRLRAGERVLARWTATPGPFTPLTLKGIPVEAGAQTWSVETDAPPQPGSPNDDRQLAVAISTFIVRRP